MTVSTSTFVRDAVLFVRDALASAVTDPISSSRPAGQKFVLTAYPEKPTVYPLITVMPRNIVTDKPLGQSSNGQIVAMVLEVRVWGRTATERDKLTQETYNALRSIQLTENTGSNANNLFDFTLRSSVPIDEKGKAGIHSMVSEYSYGIILN